MLRPKAYRHAHARRQKLLIAVPAILLMIALHGWFLHTLLRPIKAIPPKVYVGEVEVEYEIPLIPIVEPPIEQPKPEPMAATKQVSGANPSNNTPAVNAEAPQPAQTEPLPASPVLVSAQAIPKPAPILDVSPTQASTSPTLQFNVEEVVPTQSTTEDLADELGAETGMDAPSEARVMPSKPLALNKPVIDAPDTTDRAPISPLQREASKFSAPVVSAVEIPAKPELIAPPIDQPLIALERAKPELTAPSMAPERQVAIEKPNPSAPSVDLKIETPRVQVAKPTAIRTAPQRVLNNNSSDTLEKIEVTSATQSPKLEINAPQIQAPELSAQTETAPVASANKEREWTQWTPSRADGKSNVESPSRDPFAAGRAATDGVSGGDLMSQAGRAAAAQVGEAFENAPDTRRAFRRYNDPFAEDRPNPFAGLRMREPQLFLDVTKFLVDKLGPVAWGALLGNLQSDEQKDFTGQELGPLIERYLYEHHGDLKRECELGQENSMPDHVRKLICGSY
jgi:hypothetical protein